MVKRIKQLERKLTHSCSTCSATFSLRETHLKIRGKVVCAENCVAKWEELLQKHYREKVLGQELEQNKENHGSN